MLPNRCQFAPISATNGVVKPFVGCDMSFPLRDVTLIRAIIACFWYHYYHYSHIFHYDLWAVKINSTLLVRSFSVIV